MEELHHEIAAAFDDLTEMIDVPLMTQRDPEFLASMRDLTRRLAWLEVQAGMAQPTCSARRRNATRCHR